MVGGEPGGAAGAEALGAVEGRKIPGRVRGDGERRRAQVLRRRDGGGGGGRRKVKVGAPPHAPLFLVGILMASESLGLEELLVAEKAMEELHILRLVVGGRQGGGQGEGKIEGRRRRRLRRRLWCLRRRRFHLRSQKPSPPPQVVGGLAIVAWGGISACTYMERLSDNKSMST